MFEWENMHQYAAEAKVNGFRIFLRVSKPNMSNSAWSAEASFADDGNKRAFAKGKSRNKAANRAIEKLLGSQD